MPKRWSLLLLFVLAVVLPPASIQATGALGYVQGVCITLQGSENHRAEIERAAAFGANAITILIDYGLDDQGRPTVHELYGLDSRFRLPWETWRSVLEEMITIAHQLGLSVELKNAETGNGEAFEYAGDPEDYIRGYLDTTAELAKVAEEHAVERFSIWTEADHIVEQGMRGTVDPENFEAAALTDWSRRMRNAVQEHFTGAVGIGFGGTPPSFEYLASPTIDLRGFDYVEVTFYGDVYSDYVTETPQNALQTIAFYRDLADKNGIATLIIGEMALEEEIGFLSPYERQRIYNDLFHATCNEVDGFYLMLFPPNPDPDLLVVAEEWYKEDRCAKATQVRPPSR